jgi:aminoglycoside phosphotransferase (APT) family kinase protein
VENLVDRQIVRAVHKALSDTIQPKLSDTSAIAALQMNLQLLDFVAQGDAPKEAVAHDFETVRSWSERVAGIADETARLQAALSVPSQPKTGRQRIIAADLQPYIRERLRGGANARVADATESLGGFSKETYIVSLENSEIPQIVIRRDPVSGPVERTAAAEFPILSTAFRHGVRVPEPLWADPAAPFGRSVVVTRFVGGRSAFDLTGTTIGVDQAPAALALARTLAQVHALPLEETELDQSMRSAPIDEHVRQTLRLLEDQWHRRRIWQSDILDSAFAWMRDHIPTSSARAVVVHGDASLRNLLMQGDDASALLDWELWHVGDPIEDLAYCRPDVEQVLPWDQFMAAYRAGGGAIGWEPAVGDYYGLWGSLRNAVLCSSCLHGFVRTQNAESRMAYAGVVHYRRLLLDVASRLTALAGP